MRAYFGILPRSVPLAVSSLQAVHAGMALLDFIRELNEARAAAGQVPLDLSIGVCSGMVVAGGVEALGQIRLTALGAASDQAQIIARAAAAKPGSTLLISMDTQRALHNARDHFTFGRQGELPLSGEGQRLGVIEVLGRTTRLIDSFDPLALSGGLGGPVEG
jgi:class 3 adenylate cyclase